MYLHYVIITGTITSVCGVGIMCVRDVVVVVVVCV